jgi:hypothetical protein
MVRPISSSPHEQSATVRQLKLLVIVLVLSNVGLGVLSFYLLRTLDRRYSELFDHSVPVLNGLQTLTARAMQAMRVTNPELFAAGADRSAAVQRAKVALAEDRDLRTGILRAEWSGAEPRKAELRAAGEVFALLAAEVNRHHAAGRHAEAARLRASDLRAAFDRYIAATTAAADSVELGSRRTNESVSERTASMAAVVLGLAGWPLIVLLLLLLLTALFVVVLMVLFRGREMNDAP